MKNLVKEVIKGLKGIKGLSLEEKRSLVYKEAHKVALKEYKKAIKNNLSKLTGEELKAVAIKYYSSVTIKREIRRMQMIVANKVLSIVIQQHKKELNINAKLAKTMTLANRLVKYDFNRKEAYRKAYNFIHNNVIESKAIKRVKEFTSEEDNSKGTIEDNLIWLNLSAYTDSKGSAPVMLNSIVYTDSNKNIPNRFIYTDINNIEINYK